MSHVDTMRKTKIQKGGIMKQLERIIKRNANTCVIAMTLLIIGSLESYIRTNNILWLLMLSISAVLFALFSIYSIRQYKKVKKATLNSFHFYLTFPLLAVLGYLYNARFFPNAQTQTFVIVVLILFNLWNTKKIDVHLERIEETDE